MPKIEVEIFRTVTVTREESLIIELNIPKAVLEDGEELDWIEQQLEDQESETATAKALKAADWDVSDEDESIEYNEAHDLTV